MCNTVLFSFETLKVWTNAEIENNSPIFKSSPFACTFFLRRALFASPLQYSKCSSYLVKTSSQSCFASFMCLGSGESFQTFVTMGWSSSLRSLSWLFGKRQSKYRVCCWSDQKRKFGTFTSVFFQTIRRELSE